MSFKAPSRVVFVGNIPYDLSEEQIIEIFNSAGQVLSFRLVYDRDTGRPKGFGFAEYPDADSASSAVRNLHNYEIKGRRLRVDFSNEGNVEDDNEQTVTFHARPAAGPSGPPIVPLIASTLPPLPAGKELPPGVSCADAISRTLNTLPPAQLLDILAQMKAMATNDPARAAELLQAAPQLGYAVFQSLLLMNLVSPDSVNAVVESGNVHYPPAPPPQQQQPPQHPQHSQHARYQQMPPQQQQAPPPQDQDNLMKAVMELPQATIDALPEAERIQIMALRASFGIN